jgi:hypothetical protein
MMQLHCLSPFLGLKGGAALIFRPRAALPAAEFPP